VEAADPWDFFPEPQCTRLQDAVNINHYKPLGCRNNNQHYSTKISLKNLHYTSAAEGTAVHTWTASKCFNCK